jgi:putative heme-binding domain-containing protein
VDEIGLNVGAIHALWTMHGLDALEGSDKAATRAATGALNHPSAGVRRNAVQVLPPTAETAQSILAARLLDDADPQVCLTALVALADCPPAPGVGEAIVRVLADPENAADRWICEAATCAAAANGEPFLIALAAAREPAAKLAEAAAVVAEHRARSGLADSIDWLIGPLATMDPRLSDAVVRGLAKGWPAGRPPALAAGTAEKLAALATRLSLEGRSRLVRLAVRWKVPTFDKYAEELAGTLFLRASDETFAAGERVDAARELMTLRSSDRETAEKLIELVSPRMPPELAIGILNSLSASEVADVGSSIAARLPSLTPSVRSAGVSLLLSRSDWTRSLVDALAEGTLEWSDLALDQRQRLAEHRDRRLRDRARKLLAEGGVLPNPDRRKVLDKLLPLARQSGDAARGKAVFEKHCAKCHVHGAVGSRVGPDLTGMAVHPKEEMLENILDPSRNVEGNFRTHTLATRDGRVLTGLLVAESKTALELADTEGKKHVVLREDVEELSPSPKSIMPEGFEKQATPAELVDLLEFLAARGKYLPLALDKVATAVSTRGMFNSHDAEAERLVFDDWTPKTFAGVPFHLIDPRGASAPNVVLLRGPRGLSAAMPASVAIACHGPAKAIHILGGVSGWGYPLGEKGSTSLIVRLHYEDKATEDHELKNGEHLADYIRRVDVAGSQFAFDLGGRQVRYLAIEPARRAAIDRIELVKGPDDTAPVVMAITLESP